MAGRIPAISLVVGLRIAFGFVELVVISAVLQLGLALPMAYYFHRATSVSMPANLLVVPFLQLLMPAAVLAIGVMFLSPLQEFRQQSLDSRSKASLAQSNGSAAWVWRTFALPRRAPPRSFVQS